MLIPEPLDVTLDTGTPDEEIRAVEAVFASATIQAEARGGYVRLSAEDLAWIVMFVAPVTWVVAKFAGGFALKAGADAWG